jgi:putative glycerol-1-phosphate prenyltransferase
MRNKDRNIYDQIRQAKAEKRKLLAILLDPDKIVWENLDHLILKIKQSPATHIFIGGSLVETNIIDELIRLKHKVKLPMVLFPEIHRRFSRSRCHLFLS